MRKLHNSNLNVDSPRYLGFETCAYLTMFGSPLLCSNRYQYPQLDGHAGILVVADTLFSLSFNLMKRQTPANIALDYRDTSYHKPLAVPKLNEPIYCNARQDQRWNTFSPKKKFYFCLKRGLFFWKNLFLKTLINRLFKTNTAVLSKSLCYRSPWYSQIFII